jgi:hypothetical protein
LHALFIAALAAGGTSIQHSLSRFDMT